MKYFLGLKATFNNLVFVGFTLVVLVWLSVFLYGSFYYLYIPAVAHSRPVYFQFNTSCQSGICSFPTANVTLVNPGYDQLLMRGQPYKIVLDIEMPESDVNRRLGMFMVKLSMYDKNGEILQSAFRSGLLQYKSPLLRYLHTFFFAPFLLAGTVSEKQLISVPLFENYEEDPYKPAYGTIIEIHSRVLEIYSATLRIHAHFSGLRYLMYYWPGLAATIGVITFFYFLLMMALFSWYRFLNWRGQSDLNNELIVETPTIIQTPIPLQQSTLQVGNISPLKSKSKQAFDLLSKISLSPEKKAKELSPKHSVEITPSKPSLMKGIGGHSRVLEVDITQGAPVMGTIEEEGTSFIDITQRVPAMSTIEEEDSCDVTPMSDDEKKIAFGGKDNDLRRRK